MPGPDDDSAPKRCLGCGYILEHLPVPRCPECGRWFNLDDPRSFSQTGSARRFVLLSLGSLLGTCTPCLGAVLWSLLGLRGRHDESLMLVVLLVAAASQAVAICALYWSVSELRCAAPGARAGWVIAAIISAATLLLGSGGLCIVSGFLVSNAHLW